MPKLLSAFFLAASVWVLHAGVSTGEDLKPEYVHQDMEGVAWIGRVLPLNKQTVESVSVAWDAKPATEDTETGFGGRIFKVGRGLGYTVIRFHGFEYNGRLAWAEVGLEFDPKMPQDVRQQLLGIWDRNGGPKCLCHNDACTYEWSAAEILESYRQAVARQLGPQKRVEVPDALKSQYDLLMTPFETAVITPGWCGMIPPPGEPLQPLPEVEAIRALVAARRVDLIINVLRGYNAGARVHALLALQYLRRDGLPISQDVAVSMKRVEALDVRVSFCLADFVDERLTARKVVQRMEEYRH